MPLLRSAARPQAVECFYCLSASVLPPEIPQPPSLSDKKGKSRAVAEVGTKWNWQCSRCQCWNVRDERGEIKSDHPAMHDPAFNTRSFALRASPSTSHLPSASHGSAKMFCHSCLTNQTLIMSMLANYLPDDNDPSYQELYASLPSYLSSLHSRYPPVCPICQPAVDEALRKADQKAQVEAWGSALRRGQNIGTRDDPDDPRPGRWEILIWRVRGMGFWASAAVSWSVGLAGLLAPSRALDLGRGYQAIGAGLVVLYLASTLWFAWDPYWLRRKKERHRGRGKGRDAWVWTMLIVLISRLITASTLASGRIRTALPFVGVMRATLAIEAVAFMIAFTALEKPRPVALRLIRPTQLSVPSTPTYPAPQGAQPSRYPNETLHQYQQPSLSAPKHHPVFGQTSLSPRPSLSRLRESEMEWEPTPPPALYNGGYTSSGPIPRDEDQYESRNSGGEWDNFAVGKQRFFGQKEGEDETGLEGLLAGWGLAEQVGNQARGQGKGQRGWGTGAFRWLKGAGGKED